MARKIALAFGPRIVSQNSTAFIEPILHPRFLRASLEVASSQRPKAEAHSSAGQKDYSGDDQSTEPSLTATRS
jgi:hypothetical protein